MSSKTVGDPVSNMVDSIHKDDTWGCPPSFICMQIHMYLHPINMYICVHTWTYPYTHKYVGLWHSSSMGALYKWLSVAYCKPKNRRSSRVLLYLLDTEHIPVMSGSVPWLYIWFSACSKKCSGFNVMQIKHHVISPVSQQMIPAACPSLHNCAKQLGKVIVISF